MKWVPLAMESDELGVKEKVGVKCELLSVCTARLRWKAEKLLQIKNQIHLSFQKGSCFYHQQQQVGQSTFHWWKHQKQCVRT